MIVWINGAFGSGKTQTAHALHRRIPGSYVYDPERAGYFIRRNMPKALAQGDFQDFPMWRSINASMLRYLDANHDGPIIVPMTIVNPVYWREVVGQLCEEGIDVRHFTLCASEAVLRKRLKSRGEGGSSWAAHQIERCVAGLADETFRVHLDTDRTTIADNVERIAAGADLVLAPDNRGPFRAAVDRLATQIKHIRFRP
ncbi:AAA family ATPase [Cohnella sp. REN36]|uniref:AAA family ATPase n=1 Tax=Cohnella sp. REN36 TaxID=2887347 RepID=UPI001D151EDF|nr:AAA family ATPase [Cohnella sp. REN36]MCC3373116.1 AAA family ATPase [Cohnella sp. REN36]